MKKLLAWTVVITVIALSSCTYDDDDLWNSVHGLEDRVAQLETLCQQMNTNISSLQTIVDALQQNDYITNVTPIIEDGKEIGYTIVFNKCDSIVIYHGKDGEDGMTPSVGIKQDADGIYYWTLDGEWLVDDQGGKIKAEGMDGADGADGITPKFKIDNDYWYISYDNGKSWEQLGKATGEDGQNGADGDSLFKSVRQDDQNVYFELMDGTIITIAKAYPTEDGDDVTIIQFNDETVKAICVCNWDLDGDGELSHGEAAKVTSIRKFFRGTTIRTFDELQYFTGIDEIGVEAFRQCQYLTNITIPQNVVWVEEYAFSGCSSLTDIIIPERVTWIGNSAFSQCNNLTDIIIPVNVATIGNNAFLNCSNLESITIPDNVTMLGNAAFQGCVSLNTAIIGCGITKIGSTTFSNCRSLTEIVIPQSVIFLGSSAFSGCSNLKEVYCTPIIPPILDGNTVFNSIASDAVFYVPKESLYEYKTAQEWERYAGQIVSYE